MMETRIVSLAELEPGESAIIRAVAGESTFRRRLLDMGFRTGIAITVIKQAPLADPVEYLLDGSHVSLRREEARGILVERFERGRFRSRARRGRGGFRFRFRWRRGKP